MSEQPSKKDVAILCAARNSIYKTLPNCDVYDINRDARTFSGKQPIIAHPPCRAWSPKVKHLAKPLPDEKELGLWCCNQLIKNGGIIEQPAFSELFSAANFPTPSNYSPQNGNVRTVEVWQAWWGYPMKKATWLAFVGIDPNTSKFH